MYWLYKADFQSAVSRISNPQTLGQSPLCCVVPTPADWKSAIQQIGNLRYETCLTELDAALTKWFVRAGPICFPSDCGPELKEIIE